MLPVCGAAEAWSLKRLVAVTGLPSIDRIMASAISEDVRTGTGCCVLSCVLRVKLDVGIASCSGAVSCGPSSALIRLTKPLGAGVAGTGAAGMGNAARIPGPKFVVAATAFTPHTIAVPCPLRNDANSSV